MNTTSFTPGPWLATQCNIRLAGRAEQPLFHDGRWVVLPEDDTERLPLAEVDHGDDRYEPARKQAEHDAYLIAAAPEMYGFIHRLVDDGLLDLGWHEEAEALMAKARG